MGSESSKTDGPSSERGGYKVHQDACHRVVIPRATSTSPSSLHQSHDQLKQTSSSSRAPSTRQAVNYGVSYPDSEEEVEWRRRRQFISKEFGAMGNRDTASPPYRDQNKYGREHAVIKQATSTSPSSLHQSHDQLKQTSSSSRAQSTKQAVNGGVPYPDSEDEVEWRSGFINREFGAMGNRDTALPPCLDWNKYERERAVRRALKEAKSPIPDTSSQIQIRASLEGSNSTFVKRSVVPVTCSQPGRDDDLALIEERRVPSRTSRPVLGACVASSQTRSEASVAPSQTRSEVSVAPSQTRSELSVTHSQSRSEVSVSCSQTTSEVSAAPSQAESELSSAPTLLRLLRGHLNGNHESTLEYFELLIDLVDLVAKCPPPSQSLPKELNEKYQNSLKFLASFKNVEDMASQTDSEFVGIETEHKHFPDSDISCLNQPSSAVANHVHGAQNHPLFSIPPSSDESHDPSRECLSNGTARLGNASSSESLTSSEKSFDNNSPTLVCEDCKDEVSIYNGDISLSWDRHCLKPRHQLAIRPAEKEHPLVIPSKPSASPAKVVKTDQGSSSDWFNKQVDKIGEKSNVIVSLDKFTCKVCGVISTNPVNMMEHLKGKNHTANKKAAKLAATKRLNKVPTSTEKRPQFNCQVCQKAFLSEIALLQHLDSYHSDPSKKSTKNVSEISTEFLCKFCYRSFKKELALLQHSKDTHGCEENVLNKSKSIDPKEALSAKTSTISCPNVSTALAKATQEIPVQPAQSKGSTSTPSKSLEIKPNEANHTVEPISTWISVKGGHTLSIEKILKIFSKFGTIKFIDYVTKSKVWRIQYQSSLNVAHIVRNKPEIRVNNMNMLVHALPENEAPTQSQRKGTEHHQRLSLELTMKAQSILSHENVVSSTCQQLEEDAKCAHQQSNQVHEVCKMIESLLSPHYPHCRAYQFGSRAAGLASSKSDVDIYFDIGNSYKGLFNQNERDQKIICDIVANVLTQSKACRNISKVPSARVPIVKFIHKSTRLACDISFRSGLGHRNTQLIRLLLNAESRLRPLLLITKEWLRCCCIEAGKRGMTSYALSMMVIFYLQCLPIPVLPPVNYLQLNVPKSEHVFVNGWDCTIPTGTQFYQTMNKDKVPELLRGFFIFYSGFDFDNYVVCPLLGKPVPRDLFGQNQRPPSYTEPTLSVYLETLMRGNEVPWFAIEKPMCVQDPFDLSHNVTKGVPHFLLLKFQYMCRESQKVMAKWKLPCRTLHAPPGWPGPVL